MFSAVEMAIIKSLSGGSFVGIPSDLFSSQNYKMQYDETTQKLELLKFELGVWSHVLTFGSVYTSMFITEKAFGGYRGLGADGYEYFIGRISTGGDGRSVILGSFDTMNYLACTEGYKMVIKTDIDYLSENYANPTFFLSKSYIEFNVQPEEDVLLDKFTLKTNLAYSDVYFNTAVYNDDGSILYSDLFDDDKDQGMWARGKRSEKFKFNITTTGVSKNTFLLPQPIPVRAGQIIKVKYWFSKPLLIGHSDTDNVFKGILGKKLKTTLVATEEIVDEKIKNDTVPQMAKHEREALTGASIWQGKRVFQTNESVGDYVYIDGQWKKTSNMGYFYAENLQSVNPTLNGVLLYNANESKNLLWDNNEGNIGLYQGTYKITAYQNIFDNGAGLSYRIFHNGTIPVGVIGSAGDVTGSKGVSCPAFAILKLDDVGSITVKVIEDNTTMLDPTGSFLMIEQIA